MFRHETSPSELVVEKVDLLLPRTSENWCCRGTVRKPVSNMISMCFFSGEIFDGHIMSTVVLFVFLCFSRVLGRVPKIIHYLREEHPPVFPLVFHLAVTVKLCRILCWQTQRTRWRLEVVVRGTTKKPGTGPEMSVPWDLETNHNLGFTQKGTIFQPRIFHGDTTTSKKGTDWKKSDFTTPEILQEPLIFR